MDTHVRPMRSTEGAVLDTVFARLSPHSRYLRFHSPVGRLGPPMRRALLAVDGWHHVALVAVSRRGVGRLLLTALAEHAERVGVRRVHALVLPENTAAFALLRSVFPVCLARPGRDATELVCPLGGGW